MAARNSFLDEKAISSTRLDANIRSFASHRLANRLFRYYLWKNENVFRALRASEAVWDVRTLVLLADGCM